jgi:short-subunit dehydrogenase
MEEGGYNIGVSVLCPWAVKSKMLESERNRPLALKNKPGEGLDMSDLEVQASLRFLKQLHENGMSSERVADIVFKAVRENKFYILPDAEIFKHMIEVHMEDVIKERNPTIININLE